MDWSGGYEPSQLKPEALITKLHTFLTTHQRLKSDEELASSFDKFYVSDPEYVDSAEMEQRLKDLKALEEFLPVLNELAGKLQREH